MECLEAWWKESDEHIKLTHILQDAEVVRREIENNPAEHARGWAAMSKRLDDAKVGKR